MNPLKWMNLQCQGREGRKKGERKRYVEHNFQWSEGNT